MSLSDNIEKENILKRIIVGKKESSLVYYSKTPWSLLFQRPHQIMRFYDRNNIKIFVTSEDITEYQEKYDLFIISYKNKDILNFLNLKTIYFTDPRLLDEILKLTNIKHLIFDLIDAPIGEFKVWLPNLKRSIKNADTVIYSHPKLIEFLNDVDGKRAYHYISNACDYDFFCKSKKRIGNRPIEFPETKLPILGYYGAFSEWLDFNIIKKYADEGKYHIVLIGGIRNVSSYNIRFKHSNITWIDHKPYENIPYYLSWFDVCLIPFKKCKLTEYVNPCKLWEYMASEKEIFIHGIDIDILMDENKKIITYNLMCEKLRNLL